MNEQDFEQAMLERMLELEDEREPLDPVGDDEDRIESVRTFEDKGLLTSNRGIVLRTVSGDEFQMTIVQREFAIGEAE